MYTTLTKDQNQTINKTAHPLQPFYKKLIQTTLN